MQESKRKREKSKEKHHKKEKHKKHKHSKHKKKKLQESEGEEAQWIEVESTVPEEEEDQTQHQEPELQNTTLQGQPPIIHNEQPKRNREEWLLKVPKRDIPRPKGEEEETPKKTETNTIDTTRPENQPTAKPRTVGDGGASWRRKSIQNERKNENERVESSSEYQTNERRHHHHRDDESERRRESGREGMREREIRERDETQHRPSQNHHHHQPQSHQQNKEGVDEEGGNRSKAAMLKARLMAGKKTHNEDNNNTQHQSHPHHHHHHHHTNDNNNNNIQSDQNRERKRVEVISGLDERGRRISMSQRYNDETEFFESSTKKLSQKEQEEKLLKDQIRADQTYNAITSTCRYCYDSQTIQKNLIISLGEKTYLSLPQYTPLVPGHCYIAPITHINSFRLADEDVWEEVKVFQKYLQRMFADNGLEAVFVETYLISKRHQHAVYECFPLPRKVALDAPLYFRQEIMSVAKEWSENVKIIDSSSKGLHGSIPDNFSYFFVSFGDGVGKGSGFIHVIDDKKKWKRDFGREIVCGMLDLPYGAETRKRKLSPAEQITQLKKFLSLWQPYDWTQFLDGGSLDLP